MRRILGLFLVTFGCSGATTTNNPSTSSQESKLAAATAHSKGSSVDACAEHGWYGDGECDTFCASTDTDCIPKSDGNSGSEPIICAQFIEQSDGVCSRKDSDACRFQDPDCTSQGTVCATISEVPDGVCRRQADDPCRFQDPDCNQPPSGGDVNCDVTQVKCQTFAPVSCPDGQVPSVVNECYGPCVDKSECSATGGSGSGGSTGNGGGGSAGAPTPVSNNNCDLSQIKCQTFAAVTCPDGQVPTVLNDCYGPCIDKKDCATTSGNTGSGNTGSGSSGPGTPTPGAGGSDGGGTPDKPLVDCDQRKITCETFAAVVCPDGQVPSVQNNCYGPCVDKDQCEPILCALYIEQPDGICSRADTDPCRGQDPDCKP